jgi:hypothetical protein
VVEKHIVKLYKEPELLGQFRERFFGQVYDLKSFKLLTGIYMFEMEEGRKYVTRDILYARMEIEPSKVRAYDERLKSLLEAGWLELDNAIKGRYRLTPLARLYVEDVGESTNRMFAAVTYEETIQYVIRAKVNPPEILSTRVRNGCQLKLIKRGYEVVGSDAERFVLMNRRLEDYALVEVAFRDNEIEIRATSNSGHTTKLLTELLQFEGIKKLGVDEEGILQTLAVMVLSQLWRTIFITAFIEEGAWKYLDSIDLVLTEAKREHQPRYYLLQNIITL